MTKGKTTTHTGIFKHSYYTYITVTGNSANGTVPGTTPFKNYRYGYFKGYKNRQIGPQQLSKWST